MALRVCAVWFLVFLVVVPLAVLSYYAENDRAYSTAQLPSTRTDGTSSSSGSSTSARSLVQASLLAVLGIETLIAAVAIKRRWMELEDADVPMALTVQTWVQIADGDFDVPIAAATTSAPEMPDSYQGWVAHFAPNTGELSTDCLSIYIPCSVLRATLSGLCRLFSVPSRKVSEKTRELSDGDFPSSVFSFRCL